ncbi:uncharacterized protein [uncultured Mediterranean phage uvMED]|nr:uncharacterized protein [uncultured Mediterranean phage uvMED]
MTFYNTISENQRLQNVYHNQTVNQECKIMKCFEQYKKPLSPSMVLNISGLNCPITSIRRAMTNLSDDGKLEKTKDFVMGSYGKKEHLWCLPKKPESYNQSTLPF